MIYFSLCLLVLFQNQWVDATHDSHHVSIKSITPVYQLAEGPHWDHEKNILYFVDIMAQKLCRHDPVTNETKCIYIEHGPCGVAIPVEGKDGKSTNKFVVGCGTDFVLVDWDQQLSGEKAFSLRVLTTVDKNRNGTRWNDGKADSRGRFWGGTMGPEINGNVIPNLGSFYRIDSDFNTKVEISPVSISNGLTWSLDDKILYYIDTPTRKIMAYKYDAEKGTISDPYVLFDYETENVEGLPDGMTIDSDGNLWVACFGGHQVIQVDPKTGKLLRKVRIPAKNVTSVAFGGPEMDILYVTTSGYGLTKEQREDQPYAGSVFAVNNLGVTGLVAQKFKM